MTNEIEPVAQPLCLVIHELPPSLNGKKGLMRMHWTKLGKLKRRWKVLVLEAAQGRRMPGTCRIRMVRYHASHMLEWDNAYSSLKIVLDALRYASIIDDDSDAVIGKPEVDQVKVPHFREQRIEITITPK